jgi:hypothetical protein
VDPTLHCGVTRPLKVIANALSAAAGRVEGSDDQIEALQGSLFGREMPAGAAVAGIDRQGIYGL